MAFMAALPALFSAAAGSMGGIGTALSVGGSLLGGVQAMAQGNYAADVANQNAKIADENAQKAAEASQKNALESDMQTAGMMGEQLAAQSASGISVGSRTSVSVRKAASNIGRARAAEIRNRGRDEVIAYNQQSADFKGEAANAKASGKWGMVGGILGAAQSLAGSSSTGGALASKFRNNSSYGNDPWAGLRVRTV